MQRANNERKLLDKNFNATIDALVRNYDRLDPINCSPNKNRIYKKKKQTSANENATTATTKYNNNNNAPQTKIKHYFPWGGSPEILTQDINNFIIKEAKKYWQSFYNLILQLMPIQYHTPFLIEAFQVFSSVGNTQLLFLQFSATLVNRRLIKYLDNV